MYFAKAPATLMLMGEHAVLHNKLALVAAVDQFITVKLIPRNDQKIVIHSALGHVETDIVQLEITKPFQFILACLISVKNQLKAGCDITVESEFSDQIGFGSSAAVTVASLTVLRQWLGLSLEARDLILHGRQVVHEVQGLGSGADIAACVMGGAVAYRVEPLQFEKLQHYPELCAVYSGSKLPTKEVIAIVEVKRKAEPALFEDYFNQIEQAVIQAKQAINDQDWHALAECFKANQTLMTKLGVSNHTLDTIINELEAQPGILAAKISGSGLGDCVIGLGRLDDNVFPHSEAEAKMGITQFPINVSSQGLRYGCK